MIAVVYVQLKAFFVGQSSKANPQAVGVLRVMVEYNRFFEKAGMKRVDYKRDESPLEERIRSSTDVQGFDFYLGKSRGYCQGSFEGLNVRSREELLCLLSEFSRQPFIKNKTVSPELLTRMFSSDRAYLYWINDLSRAEN